MLAVSESHWMMTELSWRELQRRCVRFANVWCIAVQRSYLKAFLTCTSLESSI